MDIEHRQGEFTSGGSTAAAKPNRRRLNHLERGETAAIVAIHRQSLFAKQLADMGFVRGTRLIMLRPGSPCIVRIHGGSKVALGEGYQTDIEVTSLAEV